MGWHDQIWNVQLPEEDLYDDVQEWCESALATSAREATLDQSIEPPRWGNSQGLSALEKLDQIALEVTTLKAGVKSLEDKTTSMNNETINLNTKIQILAPEVNIVSCSLSLIFSHILPRYSWHYD